MILHVLTFLRDSLFSGRKESSKLKLNEEMLFEMMHSNTHKITELFHDVMRNVLLFAQWVCKQSTHA